MWGLSVPPAMLKPRPELPWAEGGEEGQLPSPPTLDRWYLIVIVLNLENNLGTTVIETILSSDKCTCNIFPYV